MSGWAERLDLLIRADVARCITTADSSEIEHVQCDDCKETSKQSGQVLDGRQIALHDVGHETRNPRL